MVRFACELCNHAFSYNKDSFIEQNGSHYAMRRHQDDGNFEFIVTTRNHLSFPNIDIPYFIVSRSMDSTIHNFTDLLNNQGRNIIKSANFFDGTSSGQNGYQVNYIEVMQLLELFKMAKKCLETTRCVNNSYYISSEYADSADGKHLYIHVKVML